MSYTYNQPQPSYPQHYAPYPQYPNQAGFYDQPQPQVVYEERRRRDDSCPWLTSLLMLCCGCFLGEALCDEPCCCLCIPIPCPPFGRRY